MKHTVFRNGNEYMIFAILNIGLYLSIGVCETFRPTLMRIGELQSLLPPPNVPVMALTATANAKLRKTIARIIGVKSPRLIYTSPCKPNLVYRVLPYESIEVTFEPLLNAIRTKMEHLPRVIIYCRQYRLFRFICIF